MKNNNHNRPSNDSHSGHAEKKHRGLLARQHLKDLAKTYVSLQHELWPELASTGFFGELSEANYTTMAESFEKVYLQASEVETTQSSLSVQLPPLGACYLRYSDDNSKPRSLNQQLRNVLEKGKKEGILTPWSLVFADAAIPGSTSDRPGFQLISRIAEQRGNNVDTILVDDLSRLSRNLLDSTKFRAMVSYSGKRLLCADGFDSSSEMAKISHTFSSMQHELFSDDLARKVKRGAVDKFKQGGNTGSVPTGYVIEHVFDANGKPIQLSKGKYETRVAIDDDAANVVRKIFKLYAYDKISPAKIARMLRDEEALGRSSWNQTTISQMLKNERYRGLNCWGRRKTVRNPLTGKRQSVPSEEGEFLTYHDESMRIITDKLWEAAQARRKQVSRSTYRGKKNAKSRQADYPTRLFDLRCGYCGRALSLYRSGKSDMMHCSAGKNGLDSCKLESSKTLHIIDECILAHLRREMLNEGMLEDLLVKTNRFLVEEAAKPQTDTGELDRKISRLNRKIERLAETVGQMDPGVAFDTIIKRMEDLEDQVKQLRSERELAAKANFRPKPIERDAFDRLLEQLRMLLLDDVTSSATILAKALGEVSIKQGPKRGRSKSWIAELRINAIPVLLEIAQIKDLKTCPTTHSLEYLLARSWTIDQTVAAQVFEVRTEHRLAMDAAKLFDAGCSYNLIKDVLDTDWKTAKAAVAFAKAHPDDSALLASPRHCRPQTKSLTAAITGIVGRLRNQSRLSNEEIGRLLNLSPDAVEDAEQRHRIATEAKPTRGRRKIPQATIDQIRTLLAENKHSLRAIAREARVSHWTVRAEQKRMIRAQDDA